MNTKLKIIIGIFIALAVLSTGFAFTAHAGSKPTIKIGTTWPITGNLAFMGEGLRNAIFMAKEQLGDTKYNYEIIIEDDQLNPKLTASTANKLISIDDVDVIISQGSGPGHVAAPLARKANIIHFGLALSPDIPDGRNSFVHWTSAEEHSRVMLKAMKDKGIKKIGILGMNNQDVLVHRDDIRDQAKTHGIEVVFDEIFPVEEKDFRTLVSKIKHVSDKNRPDIIVLIAMSPSVELVTKQMREAGMNYPLTTFGSFEASAEPGLFEGNWYVSAAEPTGKFISDYKKKYGKAPAVCAGNAFDMFNLIVKAAESVKTSGKPTTKQIANALLKIKDFPGAQGKLRVASDGFVVSEAKLKMIKDGKPVHIGE